MARSSSKKANDPNASRIGNGADPITRVADSARRGELVVVIGTGVSMSLTDGKIPTLSWRGLIQDGFAHGVKKGRITHAQAEVWKNQIDSDDLDDLLAAAEFVGRKLDAPRGDLYARWLENALAHAEPTNSEMETAIQTLHSAGIPLCTLNYDLLLERVTDLDTINIHETAKVTSWMRGEAHGILHLHGSWNNPESCILGIRDYQTTLGNDVRDLIQRSLASFKRLLFIGCGGTFADPNFSALIKWLRGEMKTAVPQHYALVSEDEVPKRHADPAWHGFVEPISYGTYRDDLAKYIVEHLAKPKPTKKKRKASLPKAPGVAVEHERLLREYRAFLLKDCGQMTIEGVRADMDTAQRRFDLERLFVPLKVLPSPPDIPENDPKREEKLRSWREKNKKPVTFGKVFAKHRHLALLALPGGGKTLLLKRLAVAYADPGRRQASADALPEMDLTPVLIRCREWREHIHRPILTILRNLSDITGHATLAGLLEALLPLFQEGRILLLVDGLDEIHDDAQRSTFVEHLESFLDEYKLTRLVVTSREAGFSLVAPILARFCQRWRVAPLETEAITALCDHWHRLMAGESPEARDESRDVAEHLLRNGSLRRLAENPLLLTMLLVVKHGAGRIPPDRVSLYSRAVEVLLDTWNIKGHSPLNTKEAVPQLAYVAFELMRAGKQTATEKELLSLLEDARDNVPHIRRYATDSPYAFLKRVELRSSLLIEAGHQVEGSGAVPFYQFRHLTFQEYLAGVAVSEGHYAGYKKSDTVLTPLDPYLTAEEWKEVIPMTAVLARKQAEPLIVALVTDGMELRKEVEEGRAFEKLGEWADGHPPKLPASIACLVQCLVEEAEATPETLTSALQLIALFAKSCHSPDDWRSLCSGPYGEELLHQAWLLYYPLDWPAVAWVLDSCSKFSWLQRPSYWLSSEGYATLQRLLESEDKEEIARGLFTYSTFGRQQQSDLSLQSATKAHLFRRDISLATAAAFALAYSTIQLPEDSPKRRGAFSPEVMERLKSIWLDSAHPVVKDIFAYALRSGSISRKNWKPVLTHSETELIRERAGDSDQLVGEAAYVVAFHARTVWSDRELASRLAEHIHYSPKVKAMLRQLGAVAKQYLEAIGP